MKAYGYIVSYFLCLAVSAFVCPAADARDAQQLAVDDSAEANNPLANFTSFNLHNYYIGELTESEKDANQFWMRFAMPFSVGKTDWLMRASLPINTFPTQEPRGHDTGLGDLNVFAAYLIDTGKPGVSFGMGPQLTMPTATDDALGSGKWSAGVTNILFNASSPGFQYGYLLTWQRSFDGEGERRDVNVGALQPFFIYQLGGGTYLRSTPVWTYNIDNDTYSVPIGLGAGQVISTEKVVLNIFAEPQTSLMEKGPGGQTGRYLSA